MNLDELRADLCARIHQIDTDERYHYRNATVVENAPLALMQLHMETIVYECQRTLRLIGYDGPELWVRKGPVVAGLVVERESGPGYPSSPERTE